MRCNEIIYICPSTHSWVRAKGQHPLVTIAGNMEGKVRASELAFNSKPRAGGRRGPRQLPLPPPGVRLRPGPSYRWAGRAQLLTPGVHSTSRRGRRGDPSPSSDDVPAGSRWWDTRGGIVLPVGDPAFLGYRQNFQNLCCPSHAELEAPLKSFPGTVKETRAPSKWSSALCPAFLLFL